MDGCPGQRTSFAHLFISQPSLLPHLPCLIRLVVNVDRLLVLVERRIAGCELLSRWIISMSWKIQSNSGPSPESARWYWYNSAPMWTGTTLQAHNILEMKSFSTDFIFPDSEWVCDGLKTRFNVLCVRVNPQLFCPWVWVTQLTYLPVSAASKAQQTVLRSFLVSNAIVCLKRHNAVNLTRILTEDLLQPLTVISVSAGVFIQLKADYNHFFH